MLLNVHLNDGNPNVWDSHVKLHDKFFGACKYKPQLLLLRLVFLRLQQQETSDIISNWYIS